MAKILISAGEASGDIHAAAVTAAIKKLDSKAEVFGMGGDALRKAGGEVLWDIKDHGVMGFVEVIRKLPDLFRLRSDFARVMDERKPDCLVVVDYPGFNMKLAKLAHDKGIPVVSYIAPSAWAWNKGRAKKVAKIVDKVACIFPFEYDVYKEAGAPVEFVGHPLLDIVHPTMTKAEAEAWAGKQPDKKLVLLMPGSRLMEIEKMLPTLLAGAKLLKQQLPDVQFVMPRANTIPLAMLQEKIAGYQRYGNAGGCFVRTAECYCLPYFRTECFYRAFGNQHPQYRSAEYCCGQNDYAGASAGGLHPGKISKNCSRAFSARASGTAAKQFGIYEAQTW